MASICVGLCNMVPLFSVSGRRRLDEVVKPGLLCAFDFDGTLAPIVMHPDKASTPQNVVARLHELANYAKLAVITGRSIDDARVRLGFTPDYIIGNHGLEGIPGWEERGAYFKEVCNTWSVVMMHLLKDVPTLDREIWIENKGYSLSVHYRMARDRNKAESVLSELFSRLVPAAKIIAGKYVFNLLPPGAGDKGYAIDSLMALSKANGALYIGDDVTDEDVFKLKRPDLLTVRIGLHSQSHAEFNLSHRLDILQMLDEIILRFRSGYPLQSQAC